MNSKECNLLFLWINMNLCQCKEFHIRPETKIFCLHAGQVYRGHVQCFQASTYSATHLPKLRFERTSNCWGERRKFIISCPFYHRTPYNQRWLLDLCRDWPLFEFEKSIKIEGLYCVLPVQDYIGDILSF